MSADLDEKLSALLDGELSATEQAELRARLERSPELRARLEALRQVDARLRALPARQVPGDLAERLRARIAAEPREADGAVDSLARAPRAGGRVGSGSAPGIRAPERATSPRRRGLLRAAALGVAAALLALLLVPRLAEEPTPDEAPLAAEPVPHASPPDALAELAPPGDAPLSEVGPDLLGPHRDGRLAAGPPGEDLPVIEVLDFLEALDALEERGRG